MKFICSKSGIECEVSHFPGYLSSKDHQHPIFSIPTKKLIQIAEEKYLRSDGTALTNIDEYLLYLALFDSTELIRWAVPAKITQHTESIIACNMGNLIEIVEKITTLGTVKINEVLHLPQYIINTSTSDLSCTRDWIQIWNENYQDYLSGYKKINAVNALERKETALERLIKDRTKDISSYAGILADWASIAAEFHIHANYIVLDQNDKEIVMADYWKRIIRMCAKGDAIFSVPSIDLNDLIEHCEEYIPHGSIFSHTLMALLRDAKDRKQGYLDLGDIDLSSSKETFKILNANASIEDANKLALIMSAPQNMPQLKDYPSKIAYLRAKMNYEMAQDYRKGLKENAPKDEHNRRSDDPDTENTDTEGAL